MGPRPLVDHCGHTQGVLLRGLSEQGVTIVAAVGNDASDVEFFPAAFATHLTGGAPMVSVGALNPDHRTVSVYSNTGP